MRSLGVIGIALCLLGWLGMACQSPTTTPPSTPLPTPTHTRTPTSTPLPTATSTPIPTRMPTPTPGPLTDAEAIALVKEEVAARGVALNTLRVAIGREPRWATIRYSSSYRVDGSVFQSQTVLVALAVARVMIRVDPPINGGIRLAAIPGGESEVGLRVTIIDASSLEAWAKGSISDQEFVGQWTVGAVTRE